MKWVVATFAVIVSSLVVTQIALNFIPPYDVLMLPSLVGFALITYLLMVSQYEVTNKKSLQLCRFAVPEIVYIYATFFLYYALAAAFYLSGLLLDYLVASFSVPVIMFILEVGSHRGMLNYDIQKIYFVYSRTTFYATLRCLFKLLVVYELLDARIVRLFPLVISFAETVAMYVAKTSAYAFDTRSITFAAYTVVKAAVFLSLPILEENIINLLA